MRALINPAVSFAAALCFIGFSAATAAVAAPTAVMASEPAQSGHMLHKVKARNVAHVYLLRGLMNVFSLGMDELAHKIDRLGIATTVTNHSDWQALCQQIAARYKAGNHGSIILVGHSLGADAVMLLGECLGQSRVPVALIVPFDGTRSHTVSANVARVLNITQRDYAYIRRGRGFRGELSNLDVSGDPNIGHISIDKSPRLQNLVVKKIASIVRKSERGGKTPAAARMRYDDSSQAARRALLPAV